MADIRDCLQVAMDGGEITASRGTRAQAEVAELIDRYASAYPLDVAAQMAAEDVAEALRRSAKSRRHAVIAQLQIMRRNIAEYGGDTDPAKLVRNIERTRFERDGLMRQIHGQIGEFLQENSRDLKGAPRNKALLRDVVAELHGQASGNARASGMAHAIQRAQTRLRSLFNAYGGDIGELADFGLPHSHDVKALRAAGFDEWAKRIYGQLDWARIINPRTGKAFTTGTAPNRAAAMQFLQAAYDNITTRGWNNREAGLSAGGQALFDRRAEARVLHFKNAEAWMDYNAEFGSSNPFDAIVSHLDGMARDVVLMRNFGPNPSAGLEHAIQVLEKSASTARDATREARVSSKTKKARAMMAHLTGSANAPANHAWAAFFAGTRQVLTSAQLGSAIVSAVATDPVTISNAARAVGMNPGNALSRGVQLMASQASRAEARAMGYVADTLADAGNASARYLGDVWSPEITERLSSFVMRSSGLAHWTDMNRIAFQMEFAGYMAGEAGKRFDNINPLLRKTLAEGGITAADWDHLRAADALFTAPNGGRFLPPHYWLETQTTLPRAEAEGLAIKLQALIEQQMEFAIPSVSLEGRSSIIGDAAPGTVGGELLRSTAMYKNFAVSLTLNQYRHIAAMDSNWSRAAYVAKLTTFLTLGGAIGVQLKEIIKGRDPQPMDDPAFWGAALFQGGGLGIFGDFFSSNTSRAGGGLAETLAGPVVGLAGDIGRAAISNVSRAIEGKDTLIGRDIANLARRYTPGTSLWYARAALDRMVWDQMQSVLDPEAESQWRAAEGRQRRERGNASWWERGNALPGRAPNIANITGGQ